MTEFAEIKPRYDYKTAEQGVWITPVDEVGNEYGGFLIGYFNAGLPRVKQIIERYKRLGNAASRNARKESAEDAAAREQVSVFVEACVLDWDQKNSKGAIPFSREVAIEYFLKQNVNPGGQKYYVHDFAFEEAFSASRDITRFQSDEQVEAGDATGN